MNVQRIIRALIITAAKCMPIIAGVAIATALSSTLIQLAVFIAALCVAEYYEAQLASAGAKTYDLAVEGAARLTSFVRALRA